jgi:hypothetical protein
VAELASADAGLCTFRIHDREMAEYYAHLVSVMTSKKKALFDRRSDVSLPEMEHPKISTVFDHEPLATIAVSVTDYFTVEDV